ncbi:MAG: hypothetical protein BWY31_03247 [Lentisphaerae bacterium ADurb.Bin242]|nr:MAG: hypothetical protein BWY31_03247 [Lentisphaerae bacterium ADurb.Bin242]
MKAKNLYELVWVLQEVCGKANGRLTLWERRNIQW